MKLPEKIGVVGAGRMGAEIAFVHALAGLDVVLTDLSDDVLDGAIRRLHGLFDKGVARGLYRPEDKDGLFARIAATSVAAAMADRELLIEAVFENERVKAETLAKFDAICPPGCIFATNTSTIPITVLASALGAGRRSRFVGTHYFSPVSRMKLVEIIPAMQTDDMTVAVVTKLAEAVGKAPVPVKDVAGFAVNRLLHVFLIEAVRLVEEGVATPQDIDRACQLGLGHPVGPFALMDATSSALCLEVQEILHDAYGERFRPRSLLKQRVRGGYVGGRGRPGWIEG